MKLISKLSPKAVCGKIAKPEAPVMLARIFGITTKTISGSTNYGDFIGFAGDFKAVNLETGEEFRSGKCFLPDIATDLLLNALQASGETGSKEMKGELKRTEKTYNGKVEFAFDIGVVPADTVAGYSFTATPLMETSAADPLKLLEAAMKLPALPAPKVAAPAVGPIASTAQADAEAATKAAQKAQAEADAQKSAKKK